MRSSFYAKLTPYMVKGGIDMNDFLKKVFDLEGPETFDEIRMFYGDYKDQHWWELFGELCLITLLLGVRLGYLIIKAIVEWIIDVVSLTKMVIVAFEPKRKTKEES